MAAHPSANIATCAERPVITTIMSVFITSKESPACAVAPLLNASSLLNGVLIFVQAARNSHRREKSRRAAHSTPWEVRENHINRSWNFIRLTTLQGKCERDVASRVTHRASIKCLISILEMHYSRGCGATDPCNVFGPPCINCSGRESARGVVRRPCSTTISRHSWYRRNL